MKLFKTRHKALQDKGPESVVKMIHSHSLSRPPTQYVEPNVTNDLDVPKKYTETAFDVRISAGDSTIRYSNTTTFSATVLADNVQQVVDCGIKKWQIDNNTLDNPGSVKVSEDTKYIDCSLLFFRESQDPVANPDGSISV